MLTRRTLGAVRPTTGLVRSGQGHVSRRLATSLSGEVEFDVQGDPSAPLSTRPWVLPAKEEIKRQLTEKAWRVGREAEAKLEQGNPLIRNAYTLVPFDAAELEKEISTVDQPKIRATQETAFDTKDYEFITDFLASRMAGLMDEPSFGLYYGKPQPFIQMKKDWQKLFLSNLRTTVAAQQKKMVDDFITSYKAFQKAVEESKTAHNNFLQQVKHDAELEGNKDLFIKSLTAKDNRVLSPKEQDVFFSLVSDSLPSRLARVAEARQQAEDALLQAVEPFYKGTVGAKQDSQPTIQ